MRLTHADLQISLHVSGALHLTHDELPAAGEQRQPNNRVENQTDPRICPPTARITSTVPIQEHAKSPESKPSYASATAAIKSSTGELDEQEHPAIPEKGQGFRA
jgi:hypothetical protein